MRIVVLAPSDKSFISDFLPNSRPEDLPEGYFGAPFIGTIIKQLLTCGHEVIAITTTKLRNNDYRVRKFNYNKFSWITVPARPHAFGLNGKYIGRIVDFYLYERQQMLPIVIELSPDFIHAHWSYEFSLVAIKSGFPCLVTVHDNAYKVLRYFKNAYRFGRLLMAEWVLRNVRFASTVSPYMLKYAKKRCKDVKVIPNPLPINPKFEEISILIQQRVSLLSSPKLIMVNNGWDSRKNGINGLLAFKSLLEDFPNASLHLFGNGSEINGKAHKESEKFDIQNVFFHGPVPHDQLIAELKSSHLLIHPALEESFGVVLIEAMVLGVPAIGGLSSGAVPWVINDVRLLADVKSPFAIKAMAYEILKSELSYIQIAHDCYNNTRNRFSADFVIKEYLEYYNTILKSW